MCEIRDLGRKWPYWHTLTFSNDMRFVCPKDVKKCWYRGLGQYMKKWAAKHEYEELKEGTWLELGRANVVRKIFLEGGWTQKRLFDVGWSDVS